MKSEPQYVRHMRARGLVPQTQNIAISEAYRDLQGDKQNNSDTLHSNRDVKARPWENVVRQRYNGIIEVYKAAAKELSMSSYSTDRQLALKVAQFTKSIPKPVFAHDLYKQALERQITERTRQQQLGGEHKREEPER